MELTVYRKQVASKIRSLAQSYLKDSDHLSTTERCCISIRQHELSIISINRMQSIYEIALLKKMQFDDMNALSLVLTGLVDSRNLSHIPVYWLLGPEDYQLNLIESMPVPANELQTALSWRIRSLISYPIDEAVLEYFELPAKKSSHNTPLIAAVTAQKAILQPYISLLKNCGLKIAAIDIPELAMLNLTALYENDEKCTAFLNFYEKIVILNISCQKVLYFTRRIIIPFTGEGIMDYEKLSLEIMRYFDFFRSQWRLSSPTRIFAAAERGEIQIIAQALTERLLNTVTAYKLNSTLLSDAQQIDISTNYLLDYGCLLRKDSGDASSGN